MRWLYTGDFYASDEVYDAATGGGGSTIPAPVVYVADAVDSKTGRRIIGGLQTAAGAVTTAGGVALGWTGLGIPIAAIGADMTQSGARQLVSGEWTSALVSQGVQAGVEAVGVHPDDVGPVTGAVTGVIQGGATAIGAPAIAGPAKTAIARSAFGAALASEVVAEWMPRIILDWAFKTSGGKGPKLVATAAPAKIHGNSLNSPKTAYLYKLVDGNTGNLVKWGVTQDMATRYPKWFMRDKEMIEIARGSRRDMIRAERSLVETKPGPSNHEPWAGSKCGDTP